MNRVKIEKNAPSKGIIPKILENQFIFRKTNKFIGESYISLFEMLEPTWWNRPLKENTTQVLKKETNGIFSYNLPLISAPKWKSNYNLLLNLHSIPIAVHLQFKNKLTKQEKLLLKNMSYTAIKNTLLRLGVQKEALTYINNDILLNGKKIVGGESVIQETIFEEDIVFTLSYLKEQELFNQLTYGIATPKNKITGVFDEIAQEKTLAECLEILKEQFEILLDEILKTNSLVDKL